MAYAAARFANSLLHAMKGHADIVECTFVECDVVESPFFASPVLLGVSWAPLPFGSKKNNLVYFFLQPNGVERVLGPGKLNEYESELLKKALPELRKNINRGIEFAAKY